MRGNRERGGSGPQLAPILGPCGRCPQTVSPHGAQRSCYFLYFRFIFIGEKARAKNKWPKTDEKTIFGDTLGPDWKKYIHYAGVFSSCAAPKFRRNGLCGENFCSAMLCQNFILHFKTHYVAKLFTPPHICTSSNETDAVVRQHKTIKALIHT